MVGKSQVASPLAVIIAGVAGSGKSTLGRSVAQRLRAPFIDLDSITNPLLDALFGVRNSSATHWLTTDAGPEIRDARYSALRTVAHDQIATAGLAVVVAPFTAELRGGLEWQQLLAALHPARLAVFYLTGDPSVFESRRATRGSQRDVHRDISGDVAEPEISHYSIDSELNQIQQIYRVLSDLGIRGNIDEGHPIFEKSFEAVLFDLDGTLVDSTASVNKSWRKFAEHYGVSSEKLSENHGKTAKNLVDILLPAVLQTEGLRRITDLEIDDAVGLKTIRGASVFFHNVPARRRAVVTSGSLRIATARLNAAGIEIPAVIVTGDRVKRGKPDAEPFLTAAKALGFDPKQCLVFEDAPAGISAARDAGSTVVALRGTVEEQHLADADLIIDNFEQLILTGGPGDTLRLAPAD